MSKRRQLIIWGAKGHAKVLAEAARLQSLEVVAVFDNNPDTDPPFAGVPLITGREGFLQWKAEQGDTPLAAMVAIGGSNSSARLDVQRFLESEGVAIVTALHPTAHISSDAILGNGCQILANSTVGVDVTMGDACIINTSAVVDHESRLGDCVHIAPNACLTGCVAIGSRTFIGAGAVVLSNLQIGEGVLIGAGSVVTRDIPDNVVAYGNPARVIRETDGT